MEKQLPEEWDGQFVQQSQRFHDICLLIVLLRARNLI